MSTRSYIAIENQDKTVTTVYCHFDGYISNNGKILFEHYQDKNKIQDLISKGNLRSLEAEVENIDYYGGEDCKPVVYKNEQTILDKVLNTDLGIHVEYIYEYIYLFKDGKWFVLDSYKYKKQKWGDGFIELSSLVEKLNEEDEE